MSGRDEYPNENTLEKMYWDKVERDQIRRQIEDERDGKNTKTMNAFLDAYLVPDEESAYGESRNLTEEEKAYIFDVLDEAIDCMEEEMTR